MTTGAGVRLPLFIHQARPHSAPMLDVELWHERSRYSHRPAR